MTPGEVESAVMALRAVLRREPGLLEQAHDDPLSLELTAIEIEAKSAALDHAGETPEEVREQLRHVIVAGLEARLLALGSALLGPWALPDEPVGTNEPSVVPTHLQAIRSQLHSLSLTDEMALVRSRDAIASWLHNHLDDKEHSA